MSITRVRSRWLVAWDGAEQRLIPHGELVHRDERVLFVGHGYDGHVDHEVDATDKLVLPGFVNLHVHAGSFAIGRLFADQARREPLALGFLQYAAPRSGASNALAAADPVLAAQATLVESLRYGCTTVVEIGGETGVPSENLEETARALGIRIYTGVGFRSADYRTADDGTVLYETKADGGEADFRRAVRQAEALLELDDPLVRPMLFPLQLDTCTPELLQAASRESDRLDVPLQLHAAQGLFEYQRIMQRSGLTPIQYLDELGILTPHTILAHAVYLAGHSAVPFAADDDRARLARSGAAVAHCPTVLARRGIAMESMGRYRRAGIPLAVGTDTYPRDLIQEARLAMYLSRISDRDGVAPSAWDALSCITNVPADILSRPDLGRLGPGTVADYVLVTLNLLRHGPVHDPISTLLHTGLGEDVRTVVIAGRVCLNEGLPALEGFDEAAVLARQQHEAELIWSQVPSWHHQGASADQLTSDSTRRLWQGQSGLSVPERRGDHM